MNAPFPPSQTEEISKPFEVPIRFSEAEIALIAPLWQTSFKNTLELGAFGSVRFQLSNARAAHDGILYLTVKVSRHIFYVCFSSANWLETLLEAFENAELFAEFPETAALAFEAHLADHLVAVEQITNHEITFVTLSRDPPDVGIPDLPGATFKAKSEKWGTSFISIRPADTDANEALVQMLVKDEEPATPNKKTKQSITLNASLMADATQISCEQLRQLQPGEGFMIDADWLEASLLSLVVSDTVLATVIKEERTFKIDESYVPKPAAPAPSKPAAPAPSKPAARRTRRMTRERTKSDE